jgi:tRNA (uracil-5-)-methyltransferase
METLQLSYLNYIPEDYEQQLEEKISNAINMLGLEGAGIPLTICRSPRNHYRHRCRFGIGDDGTAMWYTMWENGAPTVRLLSYPLGSVYINLVMEPLLRFVEIQPGLRDDLRATHFLSTTRGDLSITLIYEKHLTEDWCVEATALFNQLGPLLLPNGCNLVGLRGRSKGVKFVIGKESVRETFHLANGNEVTYLQIPDGFSNPNPEVNVQALNWICEIIGGLSERMSKEKGDSNYIDFLELYCGNGNHTVALSGG